MKYDAFLSYNSKNYSEAEQIYSILTNSGLRVFFDKKCIKLGTQFQKVLEEGLKASSSIIVLIGPENVGPWQEQETYMFQILERAHSDSKLIIPILFGSAGFDNDSSDVPFFLRQYKGVHLGEKINNPEKLFDVIEAIPTVSGVVSEYERPLVEHEQELLLRNSVHFYNQNAEEYFERWKDDMPIPALWSFLKQVNKNGGSSTF